LTWFEITSSPEYGALKLAEVGEDENSDVGMAGKGLCMASRMLVGMDFETTVVLGMSSSTTEHSRTEVADGFSAC
jgi:hypothetical protein